MNNNEEMTDLNDALDDLRYWVKEIEQRHGPLHQLRHFAAVERGRSWGTGCHDYWCQAVTALDALANWQIADDAHDAHHTEKLPTLFGVKGKPQDDGSLRFDFDDPKEEPFEPTDSDITYLKRPV